MSDSLNLRQVLNIISPSKAKEGGQHQNGAGGRHAPVDFSGPICNISASSLSRSPGKASAWAADRPVDVSMAGAADVSVTLCSALAAASKRRSKIVALESQLRMLEESRPRPGKNRIGRTVSGWRGGPHALGAGGQLLGVGLGRGYGGWGGDAASMSSVDVVCSDDDRDKVTDHPFLQKLVSVQPLCSSSNASLFPLFLNLSHSPSLPPSLPLPL
jgi:hypothetical protein